MTISGTFFDWVSGHINDNPDVLRLKFAGKQNSDINYGDAITQIECRKKFGVKLNQTLSEFQNFYFPSVLSGEQATSDKVAEYRAKLLEPNVTVLDCTAGLGIDVFHFCKIVKSVTAVEIDKERAQALIYNSHGLSIKNLSFVEGDCRDYIKDALSSGHKYDYVFIDPARRDDIGKRVFALTDCRPDIIELLPDLSRICSRLLIKASPMLDVTSVINSLGRNVEKVLILGTKTECKELDVLLNFTIETESPVIEATTLSDDTTCTISFIQNEESLIDDISLSDTSKQPEYIYEAYPAVMKSGAFNILCNRYGLNKFHSNTKLLYSDRIIDTFPGKIYKVVDILPYASKVIKRLKSKYPSASIAVRNFGISADALRVKLGIKEGDKLRIYGFTDSNGERKLAVTEPILLPGNIAKDIK